MLQFKLFIWEKNSFQLYQYVDNLDIRKDRLELFSLFLKRPQTR